MLKSNGAYRPVRCTEVVRISEGPLREVPLYTDDASIVGLGPLNWAIVLCPALSCMLQDMYFYLTQGITQLLDIA